MKNTIVSHFKSQSNSFVIYKMRKFYFLTLVFLISCTQQADKEVVSGKITDNTPRQVLVKPKIYPVFKDSIQTIIPGKNGLAPPKVVKADHTNKVLFTGPRPITPGVSHLALSKKEVSMVRHRQ